jgi:hypothetical protein
MNFQQFIESAVQRILELDTQPSLPPANITGKYYSEQIRGLVAGVTVLSVNNRLMYWMEVLLPPVGQYRDSLKNTIQEGNTLFISISDGFSKSEGKYVTDIKCWTEYKKRPYRGKRWQYNLKNTVVQFSYVYDQDYQNLLDQITVFWQSKNRLK